MQDDLHRKSAGRLPQHARLLRRCDPGDGGRQRVLDVRGPSSDSGQYRLTSFLTSPRRVYYLSWLLGCAIRGSVHLALSKIWPPPGVGEADLVDVYETYEAGVYDGSGKDGGKGLDEEEVVGSPDEKDSKMLQ